MEMHHFHTKLSSVLLKNGTRNFQNGPPFERSTSFYVTISWNFERFYYYSFETDYLENKNLELVESIKI